jgi:hypothetical protein
VLSNFQPSDRFDIQHDSARIGHESIGMHEDSRHAVARAASFGRGSPARPTVGIFRILSLFFFAGLTNILDQYRIDKPASEI